MEKKYQVFISSTYKDLVEERRKVMGALLSADCIPAGMEAFVATDDEQFNVIKRVIDLCDYYVLIIGKRYGSINSKTGYSYTEMEYDYAVSQNIPILVFAIDDKVNLPAEKTEDDVTRIKKLEAFRNKATINRMASIWTNPSDLASNVAVAIMKAIVDNPRLGWCRDDTNAISQKQTLLEKEIVALQQDNEDLRRKTADCIIKNIPDAELDKAMNAKARLHFERNIFVLDNTLAKKCTKKIKRREIIKVIALYFAGWTSQEDAVGCFCHICPNYDVDSQEALILLNQFEQFGLIEKKLNNGQYEYALTARGKAYSDELMIRS